MAIYDIKAPNGKIYSVKGPDGVDQDTVIEQLLLMHPEAAEERKSGSYLDSLAKGAESFGSQVRTGIGSIFGTPEEAATAGIQRGEGIQARRPGEVGFDKLKQAYEGQGLWGGAKELARQVPHAIAEQAPQLGAMAASGFTGARIGMMAGPLGGTVGALIGAALPSFAAQLGGNVERQAQEQRKEGKPVEIGMGAATAAAAGQAALDVAAQYFTFGARALGSLLGISERAVARMPVAEAEKLAKESLLKSAGMGTVRGVVGEVPPEVGQTMLERLQAGLPLTTPDAIAEYGETVYQTALLGPLGIAGRRSDVNAARGQIAPPPSPPGPPGAGQPDFDARITQEAEPPPPPPAGGATYPALPAPAEEPSPPQTPESVSTEEAQPVAAGVPEAPVRPETKKQRRERERRENAEATARVLADIKRREREQADEAERAGRITPPDVAAKLASESAFAQADPDLFGEYRPAPSTAPTGSTVEPPAFDLGQKAQQLELPLEPPPAPQRLVVDDALIKELGVKGFGSKKVKDGIRGLDLMTREGRDAFDAQLSKAQVLDSEAVTRLRESLPPLEQGAFDFAPQGETNVPTGSAGDVDRTPSASTEVPVQQPAPGGGGVGVSGGSGVASPSGLANQPAQGEGTQPGALTEPPAKPKRAVKKKAPKAPVVEAPVVEAPVVEAPVTETKEPKRVINKEKLAVPKPKGKAVGTTLKDTIAQLEEVVDDKQYKALLDYVVGEFGDTGVKELADAKFAKSDIEGAVARVKKEEERKTAAKATADRVAGRAKAAQEAEDAEGDEKARPSRGKGGGSKVAGVRDALREHFPDDASFDRLTTIVQSESELPQSVRDAEGYTPGVRGVAHGKRVYLVADNIASGQELGVFLHEAGAHFGFDAVMSDADRATLANQVRKWAEGTGVRAEAAKAALAKGGNNDEIIAYTVEELVNRGVTPVSFRPESTWLRKVLDAFKKFFNKMGFRQDISPQELVDLAYGAAHIPMKSEPVGAGTRFSVSNPAMAAAAGTAQRYFSGPPASSGILQNTINSVAKNGLKKSIDRFRQAAANQNTYWEELVTDIYGNNALDATGMASALDRIQAATKASAIAQQAAMRGGVRKNQRGMWEAYDAEESLAKVEAQINAMVGKYKQTPTYQAAKEFFNHAAAARREEELYRAGQLGPGKIKPSLEPADRLKGLAMYDSTPEIREALRLFEKVNNRNVDMMVAAGIIDAAQATELKGSTGYVPWFRFSVDDTGALKIPAPKDFSKGLVLLSDQKDLKGAKIDDIQINDIFDNMIRLNNWMVNKSIGNDTAIYMTNFAAHFGKARRVLTPTTYGVNAGKTIEVLHNGVPIFFEFSDAAALPAFKGYETAHSALTRTLAVPANLLRKGITRFPIFSLAQLPQDTIRAFVSSGLKNPYAIPGRVLKNFVKAAFFKPTHTAQTLAQYGIVGKSSDIVPGEHARSFRRNLGRYDKGVGGWWDRSMDALEKWGAASDEALRTALYELTMEETNNQNPVLALRRAREIINFDTQGSDGLATFLRQTVPFMGVWMNDMNNLYKGLVLGSARLSEGEKQKTRNSIIFLGMQLAALTTLYTLAVGDDDDYKKLDDNKRNRSIIIPGSNFRIPVPNDGIGFLFKVIPEQITRYMLAEGIESKDAGAKFGRALFNAFTDLASFENLIPVVGSPAPKLVVELVMNRSFFTQNPIIGKGQEFKRPGEQYVEGTSEIAKMIGAKLDLSPIKIDHIVNGLSGQMGGFVLSMSNALFHAANGKLTPSLRYEDMPAFKSFSYTSKDRAAAEDYYELRDQIDIAARTYKDMAKNKGAAAIEFANNPDNRSLLELRNWQTKVDNGLEKLRAHRRHIIENTGGWITSQAQMDAEMKKLDELTAEFWKSIQLPTARAHAGLTPIIPINLKKLLQ
jgi:hypothetical protein